MASAPRIIKQKRGTITSLGAYIGLEAELIVNTDEARIHIMDGVTPGGMPHALKDEIPINPVRGYNLAGIMALSQNEYDNLGAYDPEILYVITPPRVAIASFRTNSRFSSINLL